MQPCKPFQRRKLDSISANSTSTSFVRSTRRSLEALEMHDELHFDFAGKWMHCCILLYFFFCCFIAHQVECNQFPHLSKQVQPGHMCTPAFWKGIHLCKNVHAQINKMDPQAHLAEGREDLRYFCKIKTRAGKLCQAEGETGNKKIF